MSIENHNTIINFKIDEIVTASVIHLGLKLYVIYTHVLA